MKRHGTLILGGVATGKTTLLHRLCADEFNPNPGDTLLYFGDSIWINKLIPLLDPTRLAPAEPHSAADLVRVAHARLALARSACLEDWDARAAGSREFLEALRAAPLLKRSAPGRIIMAADELNYLAGADPGAFGVYLEEALDPCDSAPRFVPLFASTTLEAARTSFGSYGSGLLESFRTTIFLRNLSGATEDAELRRWTGGECRIPTRELRPGEAVVLDRETGAHEVRLLLPWS